MARAVPQVFTVPAGQDFAETIAGRLLAGDLLPLPFADEPARLADLVIYVPTERLRTAIEGAFAAALAPRPAILPRIRALADPGDPADGMEADAGLSGLAATPMQRVISPLERRFLLLPLIEQWRTLVRRAAAGQAAAPAPEASIREALGLADALGRLIDEMRIAGVPLESLASAAPPGYDPAAFDIYWAMSRDFLCIASRYWPEALAEAGASDQMTVRLAAIEAEAARLVAVDPPTPMLVVGSTGSVTATAMLIRAVARLDHGAVVLPGLDLGLDARGWRAIGAPTESIATRFAHPQAALKRLLETIGIDREAVVDLAAPGAASGARNRMLSEALRPAESVDAWRERGATLELDLAFAGMTLIEAPDEREEALAIAVLMREALEQPEKTVALVTADRALARRVKAELRRWAVDARDSAGVRLGETPAGILARLFLNAAAKPDGGAILALLRHPLLRLGFGADEISPRVDALELLVLRGRHFSPGLALEARIAHALGNPPRHVHDAAGRVTDAARVGLPELGRALAAEFAPFAAEAPAQTIAAFAGLLDAALHRLSADGTGASPLEAVAGGAMLIEMLGELVVHGADALVPAAALPGVIETFLAERVLPPEAGGHPRARILGPLEARLVAADRIILGGLNEGSFPPVAQDDPFLNRAMRLELGLEPPERRIGQSAHDFAMLAGSPEVVLTRAARSAGQPALPSRFLRRLEAFAGEVRWRALRASGERALGLARRLDAPGRYRPIDAPEPIPAVPRLPERLSITEVETLRRDPYAVYARRLLRLAPLEPVDPEPDGRERGTILHACLDAYARAEPPQDPDLAAQHLREIGARLFEAIRHEREVFHFWWQRFEAIIPGFVAFDRAARAAGRTVATEVAGGHPIILPAGARVDLYGKADRMEIDTAGALTILDYKSGTVPGSSALARGLAPQLPITAALALRGAFRAVGTPAEIAMLAYVGIGGSNPVDAKPLTLKDRTLAEIAESDWQRLAGELAELAAGRRAYRARIFPVQANRDGDFDHLARVREWRGAGAEEDPSADGEAA